jgi:hypothetical protein
MSGILGGVLGGYADEATNMRKSSKRGLLRRKKKAPQDGPMAEPMEYRKGGRVKKTGFAKVHKGEVVVPAKKRNRRARGKRR